MIFWMNESMTACGPSNTAKMARYACHGENKYTIVSGHERERPPNGTHRRARPYLLAGGGDGVEDRLFAGRRLVLLVDKRVNVLVHALVVRLRAAAASERGRDLNRQCHPCPTRPGPSWPPLPHARWPATALTPLALVPTSLAQLYPPFPTLATSKPPTLKGNSVCATSFMRGKSP